MRTDLDIARSVTVAPIADIAAQANIPNDVLIPYGKTKAKLDLGWCQNQITQNKKPAKLILVTATNPTPAGEGKTTTTIGLADALNHLGKRAVIALREPSLGPCFGRKGGATGGGFAQVVPMEDINLHFTGDFHAITAAHNLLAAMLDNHIHFGNSLHIDLTRIVWGRVVDITDRALRNIEIGSVKQGTRHNSFFDITVASEVMAIFCLATSLDDLRARLSRIIVAYDVSGKAVTAADIKAVGSMLALLRDAMAPNLVQSLEGTPALVHGGPFANIAHGCNSVLATKTAMTLGDFVITEAGFGADLGAEKFLNIKCRQSGLWPDAVVIVATVRALKMHGGVAKADLNKPDVAALDRGFENLARHIDNMQNFGLPVVVAINHFTADTDAEWQHLKAKIEGLGVKVALCKHWADGGKGAIELAQIVDDITATPKPAPQFSYRNDVTLADKIAAVASNLYHAAQVDISDAAQTKLMQFESMGYGHLPICMAKTQDSFASDPTLLGAPVGHTLTVRDVKLSAGAGFVVALCGKLNTMPGLPRTPAAEGIDLDTDQNIVGLF